MPGVRGGGERWIDRTQRIYRTVKILYDIILTDTYHYTCPNPQNVPRVDPKVNYGWVIVVCHCRFIIVGGGCW